MQRKLRGRPFFPRLLSANGTCAHLVNFLVCVLEEKEFAMMMTERLESRLDRPFLNFFISGRYATCGTPTTAPLRRSRRRRL